MDTPLFDITINISVSIPIIGDISIMLVQPPENFSFQKIRLDDYAHKDRLTDNRGQVLSEYMGAVHIEEEPYIVCLEQNATRVVKHDKPANSFAFMTGTDFDEIIKPIHDEIEAKVLHFFSLLHLFKEGEIAKKQSLYFFSTQEGICKTDRVVVFNSEDIITLIRYPMVITPAEVPALNDLLYNHNQASQILKPISIDELEYTYHTLDDATNYKNMITPLEVMFLHNDYGDKKEMLAKRMAVFLGNSDAEMKTLYDDVKKHYHDRSEAVHEGNTAQITRTAVNELRNLVRAATLKYINVIEQELTANPAKTFDEIKTSQISNLKSIVKTKNTLNIW